jgi:hypothetical protein
MSYLVVDLTNLIRFPLFYAVVKEVFSIRFFKILFHCYRYGIKVKMPAFTDEEFCEMVIIYGECNRNACQAARLFAQRHPQARHPTEATIRRVVLRLRQTGSTRQCKRTGRPGRNDEDILAYFCAYPHSSTRQVSRECGLSPADSKNFAAQ